MPNNTNYVNISLSMLDNEVSQIAGVAKFAQTKSEKIIMSNYTPELGGSYSESLSTDYVIQSENLTMKHDSIVNLGNPNPVELVSKTITNDSPSKTQRRSKTKKIKAKMVNFLDKFRDPDIIPEDSRWEINDEISPIVKNRIRNN